MTFRTPMDAMFDRIVAEIHANPGMSFNDKFHAIRNIENERTASMKIAWNAGQFNRRARIQWTANVSADVAAKMFPTS